MASSLRSYWKKSLLALLVCTAPHTLIASEEELGEVVLDVPGSWALVEGDASHHSWIVIDGGATNSSASVAQLLVDPTYCPLARLTAATLARSLSPAGVTAELKDARRVAIAGLQGYRLHLENVAPNEESPGEPGHHIVYVLSGQQTVVLSLTTTTQGLATCVPEFDRSASTLQWTRPLTFAMPPWFCATVLGAVAGCGATLREFLRRKTSGLARRSPRVALGWSGSTVDDVGESKLK